MLKNDARVQKNKKGARKPYLGLHIMNETAVKPDVVFIDDLIFNIKEGQYSVPAFQRKYVWDRANIIELFDSIYNGYPIGSVLLWQTDLDIAKNENFAFVKSNKDSQYILDGQQRITTLYNCLFDTGKDEIWNIYFDLISKKFIHLPFDGEKKPEYFPLSKLINTTDFLKESMRLLRETENESLLEAAEKLANTIRKYKLSIILLIGGDIDSAIEIFTRLNRTGVEILTIDIIKALNYQNEIESAFSKIQGEFYSTIEKYNFINDLRKDKIASDLLIRTIRVASGFPLYGKTDTIKLSEHIKSSGFINDCESIIESFNKTVNYLINEIHFETIEELPYSNIFYLTFSHFHFNENPNKNMLESMIYRGSITETYSSSPSATEKLIDFFKSSFDENNLTNKLKDQLSDDNLREMLERFYRSEYRSQSAQVKVLFNLFKRNNKLTSQSVNVHYPPQTLYEGDSIKNSYGNKIFADRNSSKTFDSDINVDIEKRKQFYFEIIKEKFDDQLEHK